jgi:TonB family protein
VTTASERIVRGRVAAASLVLSLLVHGLIGLRLATQRVGILMVRPRRDVAIEVTRVPSPGPRPTPAPAPVLATLQPLRPARAQRPIRATPTPLPSPSPSSEATPPQSSASPSPAPAPSIDLFATDALKRAMAPTSLDPGGHLRRATDPPRDEVTEERERVGARVREMVDDLVGRERAQSGNLSSHWRDIERDLVQHFRPPLAVVKQDNVVKTFGRQVMRSWLDGPPRQGPVPRGVDASVQTILGTPQGFNQRSMPGEQALAVQAAWGNPASWLRVEVEVTLDEDGRVTRARVIMPSGRRLFDRTALAAVEDAIRARGPPVERRPVVTRWLVEAAVAVTPPTSFGFRFDETGHLNPGATGWRKYISGVYPLEQRVQTHVSLTSIQIQR